MKYQYLKARGALNEAVNQRAGRPAQARLSDAVLLDLLIHGAIPAYVLAVMPESVARENVVMPLALDGELLTCAAVNPADIGLTDKLRFILNKNVRLIAAPCDTIVNAINRDYPGASTESVESMLSECTDTSIDLACAEEMPEPASRGLGTRLIEFRKGLHGLQASNGAQAFAEAPHLPGLDHTPWLGGSGMFFYIIEEGQRALMRRPDGTMEALVGPRRVWRGRKKFARMQHFVAHPGEFLIVRYRDGRQEHFPGPSEVWFDPRVHQSITREEAVQLAAKEAVVVYSQREGADDISRRIVYGPGLFVPRAGEWLHTFSWHASQGGHKGAQKEPNALVFQKLWLMPDQMYHDVTDVRTADDAVLTIRLMIFFELTDIERMLDTTHDPIGDFVNAATSEVVDFTGRHDFESFKRHTDKLNELETYKQLTSRATQSGYRINKVVYRGYGAPASLQQMHDQAIEARTRLQLDRATEQQAQDLEDYKLDCQIARATKRRTEQTAEVDHDLALAQKRKEAELRQREAQQAADREQRRLVAEMRLEVRRRLDAEQRDHVTSLRELGVDLTAYLTQARADRVIELRGAAAHVHVDEGKSQRGRDGVS
jgi:hypothetical protein